MQHSRVLIIAQAFAPHGGSHATRINGVVEAFIRKGHDVHVLTTTIHRGIPHLDDELLSQVRGASVMRAFCGPMHYASYMLNRWSKATERPSGALIRKSLLLPDTYIEWAPFAVAMISARQLLKVPKPDLVISSSTPYSCHLVGMWVKRILGVPWLADFGDPWVLEPSIRRGALRTTIERRLELEVLRKADYVTWTTNQTRAAYQQLYPTLARKMHVVPMAFRGRDFEHSSNTAIGEVSGIIPLVYTGRLNPEHRDTSRMLELLSALRQFGAYELLIAGTELDGLGRSPLPKGVRILGSLRHAKFVELLKSSSALVLLGNSSPLQVPGKVYQYIGAKKPILYLKNMPTNVPDETEDILRESGAHHLAIGLDNPIDGSAVIRFLSSTAQVDSSRSVAQHTWERRVDQFLEIALVGPATS